MGPWILCHFRILSTYASTFGPVANASVVAGWSIDYASSDPNFMSSLADGGYVQTTTELSGYSTNDGQTWNAFPTIPPDWSGSSYWPMGRIIAASTPKTSFWAPPTAISHITRSMAERLGIRSLFRVFPVGRLWRSYFMPMTVTLQRTVCSPNTFYLLTTAYGVFETTNGGVTGRRFTQHHRTSDRLLSTAPTKVSNPFPVKLAISFTPLGIQGSMMRLFTHSTNGGATWNTVANVEALRVRLRCSSAGPELPGHLHGLAGSTTFTASGSR